MYQAYGSLHVSTIILEFNLGAKLVVYPKLCRLSRFIGVKQKLTKVQAQYRYKKSDNVPSGKPICHNAVCNTPHNIKVFAELDDVAL